ncbi:hypothetical protein EVAR_12091_1 [Eumeta japonica]|uniref:Uncharacterized protein n=1 Tax=Eumeta variegata TaxID=151549 RepID=A0A4C1U5F6_EUMVA|nr:hypothetical protein EVAR_12091_1 [Eumeta japonica]
MTVPSSEQKQSGRTHCDVSHGGALLGSLSISATSTRPSNGPAPPGRSEVAPRAPAALSPARGGGRHSRRAEFHFPDRRCDSYSARVQRVRICLYKSSPRNVSKLVSNYVAY